MRKKDFLIVKVKSKPTWPGIKDIFSNKTDEEVIHYIGDVLEDCYDLCPSLFESFGYGDVVEDVIKELLNYSIDI